MTRTPFDGLDDDDLRELKATVKFKSQFYHQAVAEGGIDPPAFYLSPDEIHMVLTEENATPDLLVRIYVTLIKTEPWLLGPFLDSLIPWAETTYGLELSRDEMAWYLTTGAITTL